MFYEHVSVHVWTNDDFYAYFVCISELPWPIEDLQVFYEHVNGKKWINDDFCAFYVCIGEFPMAY